MKRLLPGLCLLASCATVPTPAVLPEGFQAEARPALPPEPLPPPPEPLPPAPPSRGTPDDSLLAWPDWAHQGRDRKDTTWGPTDHELAARLMKEPAPPGQPLQRSLLVCQVSTSQRPDAGALTALFGASKMSAPDLSGTAELGPLLEAQWAGPEDSQVARFSLPLVTLAAGAPLTFRIYDRNTFSLSHLATVSGKYPGTTPFTLEARGVKVECRALPEEALEARVVATLEVARAHLQEQEAALRVDLTADDLRPRASFASTLADAVRLAALVGWSDPRMKWLLERMARQDARFQELVTAELARERPSRASLTPRLNFSPYEIQLAALECPPRGTPGKGPPCRVRLQVSYLKPPPNTQHGPSLGRLVLADGTTVRLEEQARPRLKAGTAPEPTEELQALTAIPVDPAEARLVTVSDPYADPNLVVLPLPR